jgi:NADPH-dependent 2,4-dienoyl-CoA reductase/sulfur reductase-like enzyme
MTHQVDGADGHLVVVGASLAGVRAAEAARTHGFRGRVTLVGDEIHLPYDRPSLSKRFLEQDKEAEPIHLTTEALLAERGIQLALGQSATHLDPDANVVVTTEGELRYTASVLATGSLPIRLPGGDALEGVHVLRTLDDARAIRNALDRGPRTVVVGAGFIGAEVASAARKRGLSVTILEAAPTPLVRAVSADIGAALAGLHGRYGTDLRCNTAVAGFEGDSHVESVLLADGQRIAADLVVVGIGSRPAVSWLGASGLVIGDGVVCDEFLRTSAPNVFAAGDVTSWHNPLFERQMRIEHYTSAAEQGAHAARNAVSPGLAQPYETVPYFWSDWYGLRIQFVGVLSDDFDVVSGALDETHFVVLYRSGDRVVGALTLSGQRHVMKYRRMIAQRGGYEDALAFARDRQQAAV